MQRNIWSVVFGATTAVCPALYCWLYQAVVGILLYVRDSSYPGSFWSEVKVNIAQYNCCWCQAFQRNVSSRISMSDSDVSVVTLRWLPLMLWGWQWPTVWVPTSPASFPSTASISCFGAEPSPSTKSPSRFGQLHRFVVFLLRAWRQCPIVGKCNMLVLLLFACFRTGSIDSCVRPQRPFTLSWSP